MPKFELNKTGIQFIKDLIESGSDMKLRLQLRDFHYADIAEIINELSSNQATYLIKLLESDKTADALAEVDEDIREGILENLSAKEIAEEIEELDTDDAADLIGELPEERQERVMSQITDSEHLEDIKELLTYDENKAGGLMAKELVKVEEGLSVLKCLNTMRAQAEEVTRVHSIYVVDENNAVSYTHLTLPTNREV